MMANVRRRSISRSSGVFGAVTSQQIDMFRAFLLLETGMKEPGKTPAVLLGYIVRYWVDFSKGGRKMKISE
jgi:hypothetical protein